MAQNTLKTRIVLVSKTTAEWRTNETVLLKGEVAIELADGKAPKIKIGDNVHMFKDLPYATMTPAEVEAKVGEAVAKVHEHTNKDILDAIDEAFTAELKTKYDTAATKAGTAVQKVQIGDAEAVAAVDGVVSIPAYPTAASLGLDDYDGVAPTALPINTATQNALDLKANAADVYAKGEVYTKEEVNTAIANAEHLKRAIVEVLPAPADADAHTIYMVKDATVTGADKYKEYMLIEEEMVCIGDSSVSLAGYATEAYVDQAEADALAAAKEYANGLAGNYAAAEHTHAISDVTGLQDALDGKATTAQGEKADSAVQSVKIDGSDVELKSGDAVVLPAYPTTLPASDVKDWAKAETKPEYTADEVGLGNVDNTADADKVVASASKLTTARSVEITGGATASAVQFDGSANLALEVTAVDAAKLTIATSDTLILDGNF